MYSEIRTCPFRNTCRHITMLNERFRAGSHSLVKKVVVSDRVCGTCEIYGYCLDCKEYAGINGGIFCVFLLPSSCTINHHRCNLWDVVEKSGKKLMIGPVVSGMERARAGGAWDAGTGFQCLLWKLNQQSQLREQIHPPGSRGLKRTWSLFVLLLPPYFTPHCYQCRAVPIRTTVISSTPVQFYSTLPLKLVILAKVCYIETVKT